MPEQIVRETFLAWLAAEDSDRQSQYVVYREFYDGDHDTQLTSRQRAYLQIKMGEEFNSNYCPIVVDALAERLRVTGFDCGEDEDLAALLWDWWEASRGDALQGVTHTAAGRDGDTYTLVDWDQDKSMPRIRHQNAYDGVEGIKVHYDPQTREIAFASKRWRVEDENPEQAGKVRRLNLYFPDRIAKYVSNQDEFEGAWEEYTEPNEALSGQDEDGTIPPWPIPWVDKIGSPLGIPVFHFKNRDQGYDFGQSELKDVIPLQNALNKTLIDLLAIADLQGFPVPYMIGDDPTGLTLAPGSWVFSKHPPGGPEGVAIGQLAPADLGSVIELKDSFVTEIARISRTPLSYFQTSGNRPAEGTLKQEEVGLVARAKKRQVEFGNSWEDSMRLGIRLYNTFGEGGLDEEATISTQWDDPQTRNEKEHLESLLMKAKLDVPVETLWSELGYNADEIAEMKAQRGEEMQEQSNIGGELLRAFEGGGFGGRQPPQQPGQPSPDLEAEE